jgi:hypothetical protein
MRKVALAAALVLGATFAQAQDNSARDDERSQRREPTRKIRVLQDPYDIASFYRSSQGGGFYESASSRHPIASYYRSGGGASPFGYSRFWISGYSASNRGVGLGYRRTIGQNGDLYLLAPTILAPVGPLTDAFLGER